MKRKLVETVEDTKRRSEEMDPKECSANGADCRKKTGHSNKHCFGCLRRNVISACCMEPVRSKEQTKAFRFECAVNSFSVTETIVVAADNLELCVCGDSVSNICRLQSNSGTIINVGTCCIEKYFPQIFERTCLSCQKNSNLKSGFLSLYGFQCNSCVHKSVCKSCKRKIAPPLKLGCVRGTSHNLCFACKSFVPEICDSCKREHYDKFCLSCIPAKKTKEELQEEFRVANKKKISVILKRQKPGVVVLKNLEEEDDDTYNSETDSELENSDAEPQHNLSDREDEIEDAI